MTPTVQNCDSHHHRLCMGMFQTHCGEAAKTIHLKPVLLAEDNHVGQGYQQRQMSLTQVHLKITSPQLRCTCHCHCSQRKPGALDNGTWPQVLLEHAFSCHSGKAKAELRSLTLNRPSIPLDAD